MSTTAFYLKFSDELDGDITEWDTLMLLSELYQHLEDLHNSVKHYFPNDEFVMLPNHSGVKRSIQSTR